MSEPRVIVAGASGFAGALAAELVWRHPRLELATATSRADAGTRLDRLHPRYRCPLELTDLEIDRLEDGIDMAIVAYPHGAAAPVVAEMRGLGIQVVDLSADFRLVDHSSYENWYGPHGEPDLLDNAVYGLTELHRDAIRGADLVANPGCYPTAAVLALAPLAERGLLGRTVIDAKSGVSGAGRGGGDRLHFVNLTENLSAYGLDGHRHLPEIEQELRRAGQETGPITFVPHLVPLDQGLLATCYVNLPQRLEREALTELYAERYADEPFIELVDAPPGVREVRERNACRLHVGLDERTGTAIVLAAIDNLWKGAAGQAIQNLNLMLGYEETEGLR